MMLRLVKTGLRADGMLILVASIASVLMWLSETAMRNDDTSATFATLIYGQIPFAILFTVLGVRMVNQKRERLFAQLPVSGITVRVSGWLSYLIVIAIACLISVAVLALYPIQVKAVPVTALDRAYPEMGWTLIAAVGALMIAMMTAWIALTRITYSATSMRWPLRIVVVAACLLIVVFFFGHWSAFARGEGPFWSDRVIQWDLIGIATLGSAFGLIALDVLFDRLADDHLR